MTEQSPNASFHASSFLQGQCRLHRPARTPATPPTRPRSMRSWARVLRARLGDSEIDAKRERRGPAGRAPTGRRTPDRRPDRRADGEWARAGREPRPPARRSRPRPPKRASPSPTSRSSGGARLHPRAHDHPRLPHPRPPRRRPRPAGHDRAAATTPSSTRDPTASPKPTWTGRSSSTTCWASRRLDAPDPRDREAHLLRHLRAAVHAHLRPRAGRLAQGTDRRLRQGDRLHPRRPQGDPEQAGRGRGLREVPARQVHGHQALRPRRRRGADPGDGTDHQARRRARASKEIVIGMPHRGRL